jgi:hypothetical protein
VYPTRHVSNQVFQILDCGTRVGAPKLKFEERFWLPHQLMSRANEMAERYGQRTPSDVIYTENKLRVMRYRPQEKKPHPIPLLMTPPLIMPYYIMDLKPGKSLVAYLVSRGLDVFMIDWGVPDASDRFDTLDDYVCVTGSCCGGRPPPDGPAAHHAARLLPGWDSGNSLHGAIPG